MGSNMVHLTDGNVEVVLPICHQCAAYIKSIPAIDDLEAEMMLKRLVYRGIIDEYSME